MWVTSCFSSSSIYHYARESFFLVLLRTKGGRSNPSRKIFSSFFAPKKNERLGLFGQLSHTVHANTNTTNPELPPLGVLFAWGKAVKTQKRKEEKKRHQPPLFLSRTRTHARARFFFGSLYLYLSVCVHSIRFYVVRERAARERVCVLE